VFYFSEITNNVIKKYVSKLQCLSLLCKLKTLNLQLMSLNRKEKRYWSLELVVGLVPALHDEDDFHVFGTGLSVNTCIFDSLTCAKVVCLVEKIIIGSCNTFLIKRFICTVIIAVNCCPYLGFLFVMVFADPSLALT
jgi:hypothetical protein